MRSHIVKVSLCVVTRILIPFAQRSPVDSNSWVYKPISGRAAQLTVTTSYLQSVNGISSTLVYRYELVLSCTKTRCYGRTHDIFAVVICVPQRLIMSCKPRYATASSSPVAWRFALYNVLLTAAANRAV